ncbi:hypothetical protein D3C84_406210 [compost metagenome]
MGQLGELAVHTLRVCDVNASKAHARFRKHEKTETVVEDAPAVGGFRQQVTGRHECVLNRPLIHDCGEQHQ